MLAKAKPEYRLIDLYGRVVCVLKKDYQSIQVLFADEHSGQVVCTIPFESMLYHSRFNSKGRYHLQVELKGQTRVVDYGKSYTKNILLVRSAKLL